MTELKAVPNFDLLCDRFGFIYDLKKQKLPQYFNRFNDKYLSVWVGDCWKFVHRLVCSAFHKNKCPETYCQVDHIDRNCENNCSDNLRYVSHRLQNLNRTFKGFYWDKKMCKFFSRVCVDFKKYKLGYFRSPKKATNFYCRVKKNIFDTIYRFETENYQPMLITRDMIKTIINETKKEKIQPKSERSASFI